MKRLFCVVLLIVFVSSQFGCSTRSKNIEANHRSPFLYQNYSCEMLIVEHDRIESDLMKLCKEQDDSATADAVMMTVGLVVFWPALIGLALTDNEKEKIATLKGEHDALEQSMTMKQCALPTVEPEVSEIEEKV